MSDALKMKFCRALDRFVRIRKISGEQLDLLFRNADIRDKKSFRRLVVSSLVQNYLDEIAPAMFGNDCRGDDRDDIENELYSLCVKINPSIDIDEITISVAATPDGRPNAIALVDREGCSVLPGINDGSRFLSMEEELSKRIIGQAPAIERVSSVIRKGAAGLNAPNRPLGSFIFVGQTGVGKTELARCLALFLFGSKNKLLRIDCSEFAMGHEYTKLIGAPPGYVGHNEGGRLTGAVLRDKGRVVVFDEIEKAHNKLHNLLLQIFDEGELTDGKGETADFRESVIILTSNVGVDELSRIENAIGFGDGDRAIDQHLKEQETLKALERVFSPEFLNRVDEVITFSALSRKDNIRILEILLDEVAQRLRGHELDIRFTRNAKEFLVDRGTDEKYGARPLKRAIRRYVEDDLARLILGGGLDRGDRIVVGSRKNRKTLVFNVEKS